MWRAGVPRPHGRSGAVRCLFLLVCGLAATAARAEVRAISDAERQAVEYAASYLARGPEAIAEHLSGNSPLRKLKPEEALAEIEVRLGPPAGATWQLQTVVPALKEKMAAFSISYPSGVDDAVFFDLVNEGGRYTIRDLRIPAQKSSKKPVFAPLPETDSKPAPVEQTSPEAFVLGVVLLAAALAGGAAFVIRSNAAVAKSMLAISLAVAGIGMAVAVTRIESITPFRPRPVLAAARIDADDYARLGSLLPLRRAIASGSGDSAAMVIHADATPAASQVAALWRAQADLEMMKIDDVKRALAKFDSPSDIPLVEILRARLALVVGDEASSAVAYEHAVDLGPGRDGLWNETAEALMTAGLDDRAIDYYKRLARMGSREADVYYSLAMLSASRNRDDEAESFLTRAWQLRPAKREQFVSAAVFWSLLRRPTTASMISLSAADEATVASPATATRSIMLPPLAEPQISGDFLHIQIGAQELLVPGGAALAPHGTVAVDAGAWQRAEQSRGIEESAQLASVASTPGAFTRPALRRRITRSALALADHNRWSDVVKLTEGLSPRAENVPSVLFFVRDVALQRLDRVAEAKTLLTDLAGSRVLQRHRDAQSLEQLGDMLANLDEHDTAIRMYDKAASIRPDPMAEDRVMQIQMNKRLATKYQTYNTGHFVIHYPDDVDQNAASYIGRILESELARMQEKAGLKDFKPVVVNIVWWHDFRSIYTGSDFILGFYQGKITLPFAGVQRYRPEIVSILSHELFHAILAQATRDQAPHWFQEGMAQRIEMVPYHANAFNMYDDQKMLAVSLLDATLRGSRDPDMITEAYIVSQTVIRFIDAKYGQRGLQAMIDSFRAGGTTEDAIRAMTGQGIAEFDRQFRAWGRAEQRVFENGQIIRYDTDDHGGLQWSKASGEPPRRDR